MSLILSAGFSSPDMAGAALGRLSRSGLPVISASVAETPRVSPHGLSPGIRKTLFSSRGSGRVTSPDIPVGGCRLDIVASEGSLGELHGLLCNSGAYDIRTLSEKS